MEKIEQFKVKWKSLSLSAYGTKAQLFDRLKTYEKILADKTLVAQELEKRHSKMMKGAAKYAPLVISTPQTPARDMTEAHQATGHAQFEDWCEFRVRTQAPEDDHPRQSLVDLLSGVPEVELDYFFMASEADRIELVEETKAEVTLLAMLDRGCSMSMSLQLPNKKVTKHVIQEVVEFLNMLCYEEVVLKSDNEPVCKVLLESVRSARSGPGRAPAPTPWRGGWTQTTRAARHRVRGPLPHRAW